MKEAIIQYNDDPNADGNLMVISWKKLVRCKDCKYYNTEKCADGFGWCNRNGTGHGSTADWFCADGERAE